MKFIFFLMNLMLVSNIVLADCECVCQGTRSVALCESNIDLKPFCNNADCMGNIGTPATDPYQGWNSSDSSDADQENNVGLPRKLRLHRHPN